MTLSKGKGSWVLRAQKDKVRRDFGLGSLANVPLAEARERARMYRSLLAQGTDPIAHFKKTTKPVTFREAADAHSAIRPTVESELNEYIANRNLVGYSYEWGGEYEDSTRARTAMAGKLPGTQFSLW